MSDRTNAQIALMCAVEADSNYDDTEDDAHTRRDARTRRMVERANHFLAFLEEADAGTETDR